MGLPDHTPKTANAWIAPCHLLNIITRAVPDHLRGYRGRFLSEVIPGVFVGRTSKVVAKRLWDRSATAVSGGAMALLLANPQMEQGFELRTAGENPPVITDPDGLQLPTKTITEYPQTDTRSL
jgi:CRISPR-associated protein Cas2